MARASRKSKARSKKPRKRATSLKKRSLASKRGWATRRAKEAKRHEASLKGWRTRAAKKNVAAVLRTILRLKAENASEFEWEDARPDWYASKRELYDAVDEDFNRYADILDTIADEEGTDWAISYGPEPEG